MKFTLGNMRNRNANLMYWISLLQEEVLYKWYLQRGIMSKGDFVRPLAKTHVQWKCQEAKKSNKLFSWICIRKRKNLKSRKVDIFHSNEEERCCQCIPMFYWHTNIYSLCFFHISHFKDGIDVSLLYFEEK